MFLVDSQAPAPRVRPERPASEPLGHRLLPPACDHILYPTALGVVVGLGLSVSHRAVLGVDVGGLWQDGAGCGGTRVGSGLPALRCADIGCE